MKKINLTIGVLLVSSLFFASNFVACSGGGSDTGTAGTQGSAAGTNANTAGTSAGTAGTTAPTDGGGNSATLPTGKCVPGAYPRDGGVCMCQPSIPDVCAMKCTDTKTDNANCGMCGHACPATSTCNNGTCGPEPTTLIPAVTGCMAMYIAVGDKLYWTDKGNKTVNSAALTGGAVTKISTETTAPTLIALRGTTLFWLSGLRSIRKSVAGAAAVTVFDSTTDIHGFTVSDDGAKVYYSTTTMVNMVPAVPGATASVPVTVAIEEHAGVPGALGLDGTTMVYPTDLNGDVDIVYIKDGMVAKCGAENDAGGLDNVNCTRIARSQGSLLKESVLAQAGKVYWVDGTSVKSGSSAVGAAASNDTIASTLEQNITTIAANATTIYFGEDGIIEKSPLVKDSTAIQIARGQKLPASIAVDGTKVYWSTGDCTINATGL